jgi:hypothetical protein
LPLVHIGPAHLVAVQVAVILDLPEVDALRPTGTQGIDPGGEVPPGLEIGELGGCVGDRQQGHQERQGSLDAAFGERTEMGDTVMAGVPGTVFGRSDEWRPGE